MLSLSEKVDPEPNKFSTRSIVILVQMEKDRGRALCFNLFSAKTSWGQKAKAKMRTLESASPICLAAALHFVCYCSLLHTNIFYRGDWSLVKMTSVIVIFWIDY